MSNASELDICCCPDCPDCPNLAEAGQPCPACKHGIHPLDGE